MSAVLMINRNTGDMAALVRLLGNRGYSVIQKTEGASALSLFREGAEIDAVIADYILPDMDALNFITTLKRMTADPPPVIFLSDRVDVDDYLKALSSGAFEFLFKPLYHPEVIRIVQVAIEQGAENNRPLADIQRAGLLKKA